MYLSLFCSLLVFCVFFFCIALYAAFYICIYFFVFYVFYFSVFCIFVYFLCISSLGHRFIYSLLDAVPPIHAESSHVATDKVPSM